ncbi:Nbl1 [Kluyveromyces lactis]|nr:Nbl1 [Kluyveromyces lactis]
MSTSDDGSKNGQHITEEQREKIRSALIARQEEKLQEALNEIEKVKGNTKEMLESVISAWKEKAKLSDGTIQETLDRERASDV